MIPTRMRAAQVIIAAVVGLLAGTAPIAQGQSETLIDGGWPQVFRTPSGATVVMYQFQASSWANQREMTAYAALSYTPAGARDAALGTIKFEATTSVAVAERLVAFSPIKVVESHFATLSRDQIREIVTEVSRALPDERRIIALDRVLEQVDSSQVLARNRSDVKADPPVVFFSRAAAVVVNIDGDPIWTSVSGTDLRYLVNTNWDLFEHGPTSTFYLRHGASWLKASALPGPWIAAGKLPASFSKLPTDGNWTEVSKNVPGKSVRSGQLPKVFVSQLPAELILIDGAPKYQPVAGTRLMWVSNTDTDLFRMGADGAVYYLVAGRWFTSPDFNGPWTFATLSLPAEFQKIPVEHDRSRVLASVPGTPQAAEALLLAQVPQTARVSKTQIKPAAVSYQGAPQFVAIEPTSLQRAVNSDRDVIRSGDRYYLCDTGIWFVASAPVGPWAVAATIPAEIYQIPASSPIHHVTYVTVVQDNDPDWVVVTTVAGYSGMMIAWGVPVWGTGWYYPPYVIAGPVPIYYPYARSYGYAAWYNPWTGAYGRSAAVYGPYGGAGAAARYNPRTGTYSRGAMAWGPYGAQGVAQAFNPRTGTYAQTRQGSNIYSSWGSTYVQRGDDWVRTNRYTNRVTGTTTRTVRTNEGAAVARGGDIYAGHDGSVYRREDGTWHKYEDGGWVAVDRQRPENRPASAGQLDTDARARESGTERVRSLEQFRNSGTAGDAGSYRARPRASSERARPKQQVK